MGLIQSHQVFVHCIVDCSISVHSGDSLEELEVNAIVAGVFQESNGARNHKLSYAEFEHVISRAPDFVNFFHITV